MTRRMQKRYTRKRYTRKRYTRKIKRGGFRYGHVKGHTTVPGETLISSPTTKTRTRTRTRRRNNSRWLF
jgi:hypothetical protein